MSDARQWEMLQDFGSLSLGDARLNELFDEKIGAIVLYRESRARTRSALIVLHGLGCSDMNGAIAWALACDPGCREVQVENEAGPDTLYRLVHGEWKIFVYSRRPS